jgi:ribosomal protein L6P/L9E
VGFSHIFKFTTNGPLKISKFSKSEFNLVSLSQQQVNQKSFILQKLKFPDSYKGKGVCSSKPIIIKEGKKKMY